MMKDAAYWISLAHTKNFRTYRMNDLINKIYFDKKISIKDFFELSDFDWKSDFGLSDEEVQNLKESKLELANNAFLAEDLLNQGYELITIISEDYPERLKINLTSKDKIGAPPLLYIKGDKQIFSEKAVAIVGSREASEKALLFTDNVAQVASKEFKVVVSGFAKGVDKQALESALKYSGRSIIVLPQGITTFTAGFKKYYKQIVEGNVLVLSIFHPKAPWSVEFAMARNPIIYALADEIYIAETSEKGGTWAGAIDGLRRGRKIFVRQPDPGETNANNLLIERGAIPIDIEGKEIEFVSSYNAETIQSKLLKEEGTSLTDMICFALSDKMLSIGQLEKELKLSRKILKDMLEKLENVEVVKKGNRKYYRIKDKRKEPGLFD